MGTCDEQTNDPVREPVEAIPFDQIVSPLLSAHLRCSSHTLNLVSTTDLIKGIDSHENLQLVYKEVLYKCKVLWNSTKTASKYELIEKTLGRALKRPVVTRWNSLFDCFVQLVELKETLLILFPQIAIADPLTAGDFK